MSVSPITLQAQAKASDPTASVFVAANAGSGKTHVLTQRVVRLLLSGVEPNRILCLTYTKAAAAEMQGRIFGTLARWTRLDAAALAAELAALGQTGAGAKAQARARQLFAQALETPGGLKIQTIHAFCEAILHQFPLEANVPGHFTVLDDGEARVLVAEARRMLLVRSREGGPEDAQVLAEAFAQVLSLGGETGLNALVDAVVARRDALSAHLTEAGGLEGAVAALAAGLDLDPQDDEHSVLADLWPCPHFAPDAVAALIAAGRASASAGDRTTADRLTAFADASAPADRRFAGYAAAMLDSKGNPRASLRGFLTQGAAASIPDAADRLTAAGARALACRDRLATVRLFRASRAALVVAERLEADYQLLKRRRGRLDFEDLIVRTADLLTRREAAAWVHHKLDQGIDHVLVDEAQDTSPRQWQVVRSLIDEFFTGEGEDRARTVFAVGDEKQSIYSFQGASPAMFSAQRRAVDAQASAARATFHAVELHQSFRSAPEILEAVDRVFADPANRRGLSAEDLTPVHVSARPQVPGLVEIWPVVAPDLRIESDSWLAPIDAEPQASPANRLARRIATQVAAWIGTPIETRHGRRPMNAGDVVILVRKRSGFVAAMGAALKAAAIPVAGADRLVITDHIAVQDLVALGRVVANAEDELSLAGVLKSPLFGFTDADLMNLALGRTGSLYRTLRAAAQDPATRLGRLAQDAYEQLEALRERAGFDGVFDFYARLLGPEGGRARLAARLGPDTGEVVDAFLDLALAHESEGTSGLDAFLADLAANPPTVKREMGEAHGAVRIMTVHAAKGLEAPVVFLVDPGSAPFVHAHGAKLIEWETMPGLAPDARPGWLWCPEKSLANAVVEDLKQREKARAEDEYRRLLYVGMTRAADRLVLCGHCGPKGPHEDSWLTRVTQSLLPAATPITDANGATIGHRIGTVPEAALAAVAVSPAAATALLDVSPLAREPLAPRPLSPSAAGLHAIGGDESDEAPAPPAPRDPVAAGKAIRRGLLVHRLLQALPDIDPADRAERANAYAAASDPESSSDERATMVAAVLAILETPDFAALFAPGSRAEVPITGRIHLGGRDYRVNGTVDRITVSSEAVLIVDYKTNRPAPATLDDVPHAHRLQLALYHRLLRPLYPDRPVRAVLLYTEGPHLVALPDDALEAALAVPAA